MRSLLGRPGASARAHVPARRWAVAAGVLCTLGGWLAVGTNGLVSGALATVLVVVFLTTGLVPVRLIQRPQDYPGLSIAVLLLTYALRMVLVLMALTLLGRAGISDGTWLAVTIVLVALTWSGAHIAYAVRASGREVTIVPEESPHADPATQSDR